MDGATEVLLQHGALGAIVVAEGALIFYLLRQIEKLQDRIFELLDKAEDIAQTLENQRH